MKIAVAADHGGFPYKPRVIEIVTELGHEAVDLGAHELDPQDDYPDFARYVGQAIQHGQAERGIVLCGSGVGACIAANKLDGVRASVCHDVYSAHQGVEHDAMNVLCLGSRIIGPQLAEDLVRAFISAEFSPAERFQRRLDKVNAMESSG
ncbi:MAG: RpiB/LacA/LacB family sugar-phosphate isomerase [Planctomycetota bacterium]